MHWERLTRPFEPHEVEWRIQDCGRSRTTGKIWARCVAYVTAETIEERLDEVAGPGGWQHELIPLPAGGVGCRIGVRAGEEWIWRSSAADEREMKTEAGPASRLKGAETDAFKRAAARLGIGRYLRRWGPQRARVYEGAGGGRYSAKLRRQGAADEWFGWDPPAGPVAPAQAPVPAARHEAEPSPQESSGPTAPPARASRERTVAVRRQANGTYGTGTEARDDLERQIIEYVRSEPALTEADFETVLDVLPKIEPMHGLAAYLDQWKQTAAARRSETRRSA